MRKIPSLAGALVSALLLAPPASERAEISLPRDHGSHPDAKLEWWYYTGHLTDARKREYGFQLTFFRLAELHLAHFAWTDVAAGRFRYEEKAHLALPGMAGADVGRLQATNEDWSAEESNGVHRVRASSPAGDLDLALRAQKPPVLQGDRGLSRKGPGPSEYSHYVSITRLSASGTFGPPGRGTPVSGTAWFDHEWGPGGLPAGVAGWDWFALQLADGSELMLYRMRDAAARATPFSTGVSVSPSGLALPIRWEDVTFAETRTWRSPRTGARYPAGWRMAVPRLALDVSVEPLVADQELVTEKSTGVTYWEGTCRVVGSRSGRPVEGRAYAELTGYHGRDVPGFELP